MGHFFPPPPPQQVAANAAQPFAPANLPPSLEIVPNPPFVNANQNPTTIWQIAAIGQPDPWVFAFEGGNSNQPYAGSKLPPSQIIVPNPPFINANKNPPAVFEIAQIAQPDPWVYAFEARNSGQPYAGGKLPPSQIIVPNPPFINANKTPTAIWQGSASWQPDPWPYVFLDNTTGGQPYGPGTFVPQSVVVVPKGPYSNQWMANVIGSWIAPDPPPTLPRNLSPGIPGQSVDNPPRFVRPLHPPYPADFIAPQQGALFPQTTVVTQSPYSNLWLANVVQSWFGVDPPPTLPRYLVPQVKAADNPPFSGRTQLPNILFGWPPYEAATVVEVYNANTPQSGAPTVQFVPYNLSWLTSVIQGWVTSDPPIQLPRYLPQPAPVVVQNPYASQWMANVIQSWFPADPVPILPRNLPASQLIVPNPPFVNANWNPVALQQIANQAQPDPWSYPFESTLGFQPYAPTKLTPPSVDNPPFAHYSKSAWVADVVVRAWQAPDPLPTLPPLFVQVPAVVNNPPFSNYGRTQLPNILFSWPPYEAPTVVELFGFNAPQAGTSGPLGTTALFTVSGPDVSVYLKEFSFDVVYTDAPITKRTV